VELTDCVWISHSYPYSLIQDTDLGLFFVSESESRFLITKREAESRYTYSTTNAGSKTVHLNDIVYLPERNLSSSWLKYWMSTSELKSVLDFSWHFDVDFSGSVQ
jgi:hypothetical protein